MPMTKDTVVTARQAKWFASVREGLERETGRSLEAWAGLAAACPETAHRARLRWMKETYGIGQNRAATILNIAFPPETGWSTPDTLAAALWTDPAQRLIADAVRAAMAALPDVLETQRKAYTAFSRAVQFAAIRPDRATGGIRMGLALKPETDARLLPAGRESWSERLKSWLALGEPAAVDAAVKGLMRQAWEGA